MTEEEAKTVLSIFTTADGGCKYCAEYLILDFLKEFPSYKEVAKSIYKVKFEKELELDD